jgi:hypothetical protein
MNNIEIIGFAIFFIALLLCFYYYDRILKTEYSNYHDQWLSDGSPLGFFWMPKGAKLFSGSFSRGALSFRWLFKNPKWAINDKTVLQYLLKLRISWAIGALAWLIMMAGLITMK